jgi:DNA-directed RNA polymerase specialized sigma24 family protein
MGGPLSEPITVDLLELDGAIRETIAEHGRKPVGIDWSTQYDDVVALIGGSPAVRMAVDAGLDQEDLVQEVLAGLLTRERSSGGWDRARGGLGTYVWLVARSVVRDVLAARHVRRLEQVGARLVFEGRGPYRNISHDEAGEHREGRTVDAAVFAERTVETPGEAAHFVHLAEEIEAVMVTSLGRPLTAQQLLALDLVLIGCEASEARKGSGMYRHAWEAFHADLQRAVRTLGWEPVRSVGGLGARRP